MRYVPEFLFQRARRLQPDLDDVAIQTQVITVIPTVASIIISILFFFLFFFAGVPTIGYAFGAIAVSQAFAFVLSAVRPEWGTAAALGFALVATIANAFIHAQAGGFTSGIWALAWLLIVPLGVYFAVGQRGGAISLGLSLLTFIGLTLLDPWLARGSLTIPYAPLLTYNVVTLCAVSLMGYSWSKFLLGQLGLARATADNLLLNVLPRSIADRLKSGQETIADRFDSVTVLFADIVDFTTMSAGADPVEVVNKLNEIFSDFDDLAAKHGLEKIKTIGDAYMVAGGLPEPRPDHVEAMMAFAVDMLAAIRRHLSWNGDPIRLRIGINTGPIVAGVIGRQKFIYDLWGDAVNTASRMEANGLQDVIQVTAAVRDRLAGRYEFEERGPITIKGKGEMMTYVLRAEN
jgi:class 3 adenylate cyclase